MQTGHQGANPEGLLLALLRFRPAYFHQLGADNALQALRELAARGYIKSHSLRARRQYEGNRPRREWMFGVGNVRHAQPAGLL